MELNEINQKQIQQQAKHDQKVDPDWGKDYSQVDRVMGIHSEGGMVRHRKCSLCIMTNRESQEKGIRNKRRHDEMK